MQSLISSSVCFDDKMQASYINSKTPKAMHSHGLKRGRLAMLLDTVASFPLFIWGYFTYVIGFLSLWYKQITLDHFALSCRCTMLAPFYAKSQYKNKKGS